MILDNRPHAARVLHLGEADAWWYDEPRGITVVVDPHAAPTVQVRIGRAALAAYLKRSTP